MNIGIDLGGTSVRAALVAGDGTVVKSLSESCKAKGSQKEVIDQIISLIEKLINPEVEGIGIGVPSVVDVEKGVVYNVVGIPSWKEVPIKSILQDRFNVPVAVDNDCNCFALGVCHFERHKDCKEAVCVTLGTGVGSTLIVDGRLYHGRNCGAGEIGSIPYLDKDYEYYCSSRFFSGLGTSGKDAEISAKAGDASALALMDEFGRHLGHLVQMIMYAYDPSVIVFGGSIARAFSLFEKAMWETVRKFPYPQSIANLEIYATKLDNAGLLGAAVLCAQ